jgi:hypothetical protein
MLFSAYYYDDEIKDWIGRTCSMNKRDERRRVLIGKILWHLEYLGVGETELLKYILEKMGDVVHCIHLGQDKPSACKVAYTSILAYRTFAKRWLSKQWPMLGNARNIHSGYSRTVFSL